MILVYQLVRSDERHIGALPYRMAIFPGARMAGTPSPCRVDELLNGKAGAVRLEAVDRRILMSLQMHQKLNSQISYFNGADAGRLLELLLESGRGYLWGNRRPPLQRGLPLRAAMIWRREEQHLRASVELPDRWELLPTRPLMAVPPDGETCHVVDCRCPAEAAWAWVSLPPLTPEIAPQHLRRLEERFPDTRFPAPPGLDTYWLSHYSPIPALRLVRAMNAIGDVLRLRPVFLYGDREIPPDAPGTHLRFTHQSRLIEAPRNAAAERIHVDEFIACGFRPCSPRAVNLFDHAEEKNCYEPDPARGLTWSSFFNDHLPRLQAAGWVLLADARYPLLRPQEEVHYTDLHHGARGFTYEQGVEIDGRRINLLPAVRDFLRAHRDWDAAKIRAHLLAHDVTLARDDAILLIPGPRFLRMIETLFELFGEDVLDKQGRLRLGLWRATELAPASGWQPPEALRQAQRALSHPPDLHPLSAPPGFHGRLRPYQEAGVGWLDFLYQHRLGGILADDMGLGKTVQVIAALLHWRLRHPESRHALIVCPTSLLPNWRNELRRFAPTLRTRILHGGDRHRDGASLRPAHVVLTTYSLVHNDLDHHRAHPPAIVIFDEAQNLKNPRAAQTRAAAEIPAQTRIALSGTPVENHLGDLWSLFHVLLPGFLGSEHDFRMSFRIPIERKQAPAPREILHARIRPLLLRRTKETVAPELPPKTEIVQSLPLGPAQAELYSRVLLGLRTEIQNDICARGFDQARLHLFDALTQLRQICCDPRLKDPLASWSLPEDSVKVAWLRETLPALVEEGRRILLFSFFTSMLDLLRPELRRLRIPFVEIRGDTVDRETPVRRFQEGAAPVFLLSLKAGGTGINLTAADTVILYDPWWNPAVEAQAIDRAHRLGQEKPVFVYKLVTEGTVESRILELQERKREWARLVEDAALAAAALTPDDLDALLAPLGAA